MSEVYSQLPRQLPVRTDVGNAGRGMLPFRVRKLEFSDGRTRDNGILGTRKRENEILEGVSLHPAKESQSDLPEKCARLESFYEGVEAAISLLGIRNQLCTFQAVCAMVEATTKRRFLQKHLAQIKFILPEAVKLEYVRSYDSDTRSKRWDLKISLLPMPAEAQEPSFELESSIKKLKIENVQRRRAFHARLSKFASTHSEDDDVPAHPMPERYFNESSTIRGAYSGLQSEFSMSVATTCIPMEINTAQHRVELPEVGRQRAGSEHFSRSFKYSFSLKVGRVAASAGSVAPNVKVPVVASGVADTILPMPINRASHRDVHTLAKTPLETHHLAPTFRPSFSVKPEQASETCDDSASVAAIPSSSVQLTHMKRRHADPQEQPECVEPIELQPSIKLIHACERTKRVPSISEFESPNKKPHFSPVFKPRFSVSNSLPNDSEHDLSSLHTTTMKQLDPREAPISWDLRTSGRMSDAVDHCSPVDEQSAGLKTPVKSSTPVHSFKSPAVTMSAKHEHTPCTPQKSECRERSIYASYRASRPGSFYHDGFKSPAATPVKHGSAIRSLNFDVPESDSYTRSSGVTGSKASTFSPCPCSPDMDVPSTPVNPSRASRFRTKETMISGTSSESATPLSSRKALFFPGEVMRTDLSMIQGLPGKLLHSVREEELRIAEERSNDTAGLRHRQQMEAGLPHLFNQLCLIFQSSNRSVFPYQELYSKVVSSDTETTDRTEVEERLEMLMELAPEWISAKKSLTGDLLYRIDKRVDVSSVRKRLCGVQ